MFGYQRIARLAHLLERTAEAPCALIAHGYRNVPQKPRVARALHGAMTKNLAEFFLGNGRQLFEIWREVPRRKGSIAGDRRTVVPRADVLADVAAENMVASAGSMFHRNRTP